jgi:hypothetical protein
MHCANQLLNLRPFATRVKEEWENAAERAGFSDRLLAADSRLRQLLEL